MNTPAITVAMTAWNAERFVGAAIDSVLAQEFSNFELLVVDDASTDKTRAVIEDRAARDSRVRLLDSPTKGRVPALNHILDQTRAPWFAVLDADDIALPQRFARQMAFLAARPDHGVVGSDCGLIGPDDQPLDRPPVVRPLEHEDLTADMESGIILLHSTMIACTDLMRAIGGYQAPFRYSQDYDLYLRLAERARMANMPDRLVLYRVYPEQVSTKHLVAQTLSAVVAWRSHEARMAGKPDPVEGMRVIPALGTLDRVFGVAGADEDARAKIIARVKYDPELLAGDAAPILIDHIRERGPRGELWRAAARLLRAGKPLTAMRVSAALGFGTVAAVAAKLVELF